MIRKTVLLLSCLLLFGVSSALGQFVQDSLDLGAPDEIDMRFPLIPDATTNQDQFYLQVWFFNDSNTVVTAGVGFDWDNPNVRLDSAFVTPTAGIAFNQLRVLYRSQSVDSSNLYQQFQFSGARSTSPGLLPHDTARLMATYCFTVLDWNVGDSIVIDTNAFSAGAVMSFYDTSFQAYIPNWTGRKVIRDTAYVAPSNLQLSEDTLKFNWIQGAIAPSPQSFEVTSDNEPLTFTVTENASWMLRSPSSGTTPKTVDISIVTVGLSPGVYFDSVRVSAPLAANSPQYVYVELTVQEPPPVISVSPSQFIFNAIVDGANPPSQALTIKNNGSSTLNWSVANSESWLDLAPVSGTDSGQVTLSVDITGLAFGDYFDTVVVTDPAASNSPVRVPVRLSLLSSLPVIDVDSSYYFVFALSELPYATRDIEVRNGGGGVLNFWIEPNPSPGVIAPQLFDFDPDSSTADDFVTITWEGFSIPSGRQKTDTVWIYSDDAVNSPQPIALHLRFVTDPNVIQLSNSQLEIDVYECDQGYGQPMPAKSFSVTNGGSDDPMMLTIDYESTLFSVSTDTTPAPNTYTVTALVDDLPVGTYLDTITVSSLWALNTPQQVVIHYNIIPGDQTPQIIIPETDFVYPYRDGSGPLVENGVTIYNFYGGCMPWLISEDVDWLIPSDTSGNVVGDVDFVIIPQGLSVGAYVDTLHVLATGASNSPYDIEVTLQLWVLIGDWNWDGQVSLGDLTGMISYLFATPGFPPPMPIMEVGNTNCDPLGEITLGDLTALIDYLYVSFTPLCDNPY